jgi:amino acid transporter
MSFAMARNRQLHAFLGRIHPKFQTPIYAVWITGLLSAVFVFEDFSRVVAVGTFALLFHYALVNLAAARLKSENRKYPLIISVLGFLVCVILLVFLSEDAWVIGIIGLAVGSLYYILRLRPHKVKS